MQFVSWKWNWLIDRLCGICLHLLIFMLLWNPLPLNYEDLNDSFLMNIYNRIDGCHFLIQTQKGYDFYLGSSLEVYFVQELLCPEDLGPLWRGWEVDYPVPGEPWLQPRKQLDCGLVWDPEQMNPLSHTQCPDTQRLSDHKALVFGGQYTLGPLVTEH